MGVRPPADDTTDEEPDALAFGIAALDAHLDAATFPATAGELTDQLGDPAVPYDAAGNEIRLSEALRETDRERFETEQELLNALHPVFERHRERASSSIVAQLRGLLPF
ncbi:hypothetical protein [Halosegnis sp.]|uniref:DUF5789 family protein n=1 Tax=Halosegnis sp. TaxID=2864959 RepID=UPI0035D4852A